MFLTIDTSSHYLFTGFSISAVLRMCRRHVASQSCYPHLRLCLSLCLSHFPPLLSQDAFFLSSVFLWKIWFQLVHASPLWNQLGARGPFWSPSPHKDLTVLDADPSTTFASLLAEDLRQKEWGDFQTALMFASCKTHIHKQCCQCWIKSTQLAHAKYYLYFQAPILANYLMHFFVYLFVLLGKKRQGGTSHRLFSGSSCKGSQSQALQTELFKAFCCVFSSLYHWLVRSTLTYFFFSYLCTSHSHL